MHQNESFISKFVVTPDGEKDFQVRYLRDENVGIICTPTGKSYFLLDSADYWYDLIQKRYPPIMRCSCKNDRFNLTIDYTPRADTEDFKEICIICSCTVCQKVKRLPTIKIDYSPSFQLFDNPITFCKQPKIKFKTYSLMGYWSNDELLGIVDFLLKKNLFVYCWYWDSQDSIRCFKELSATELHSFLIGNKERYIAIYFSEKPLNDISEQVAPDEKGIIISHDIWRKENIFMLHTIMVVSHGLFYQMEYCSEYLDKDENIIPKSTSFCSLIQEFQKYSKKLLKK